MLEGLVARRPAAAAPARDAMHQLVVLQAADGSWTLTPELAALIGRSLAELNSAVAGATGARDEILRAWATALALVWLQEHAADSEPEWRLLAAKARAWLAATSAAAAGGAAWIDAAARFLAVAAAP